MGNENLRPWERQNNESEKAFSAFKAYLEMEDRNICQLAKRLAKSRQLVDKWKQKYNWQERCIAWDKSLQEIEYKTAVKERKKMAKRHIAIAMSMQAKAVEALQKIDVSKLNASEIIRLFDTAVKIERLSRGEATENQVQEITQNINTITENPFENLTRDELLRLIK